jgi:hypothetical protein
MHMCEHTAKLLLTKFSGDINISRTLITGVVIGHKCGTLVLRLQLLYTVYLAVDSLEFCGGTPCVKNSLQVSACVF